MTRLPAQGLYAITAQRYPDLETLGLDVKAALAGGAAVIQFRDKSGDASWRHQAATELLALCRESGVPLIINDDLPLALKVGADGVHLGRDDGHVATARRQVGDQLILGASCYNNLALAMRMAADGADYLAFGSIFKSATKPGAVHCPPDVLRSARVLNLPLVAIGGISPENGAGAIQAGADFLAVIDAVFGQPDPQQSARRFADLWLPA